MTEDFSIVLPREVPRNPVPCISHGGDCGACAIAGVTGLTPKEAYKFHFPGTYLGGKAQKKESPVSVSHMAESLVATGRVEHIIEGMINMTSMDYAPPEWGAFGPLPHYQAVLYFNLFRALLSAGYYRLCTVSSGGSGFSGQMKQQTNHWIMINGIRGHLEPVMSFPDAKKYEYEIRISDSANSRPHCVWVDIGEFLQCWGGMVGVWAKPKK